MAGGGGHSKTTKRAFEDDGLPSPSSGGREKGGRGGGSLFKNIHKRQGFSKIISLSPSPSLLSLPTPQPRNITASYSYTNQAKETPLRESEWGGGKFVKMDLTREFHIFLAVNIFGFLGGGEGEEEWVHEYECWMRKLAEVVNRGLCMVKRGPNKAV